MNAHFRRGVRDGAHALGGVWTSAAAIASLSVLTVAGVLEGQAVTSPEAARAVQLRLLGGVVFGLVLPLLSFGASARLGGDLEELMRASWARYGGHRQGYALGRQALAAVFTGVVVAVLALLALGLGSATAAPGATLPMSFYNALALVWVGALGSVTYVAGFAAAHTLAGHLGRALFLVGDWVFGAGASLLALPWPRSHLGALLGADAPLGLGARDSALCLVSIAALAALAHVRRVPR